MLVVTFPDESWRDAVGPVDGVEALVWRPGETFPAAPVDVVVPPFLGAPVDLTQLADHPSVRLVQVLSAGYENVAPSVPDAVAIANAAGVHDASTAELTIGLAIAALRGIPGFVRSQDRAVWERPPTSTCLTDRRALVVGYGSVGRAIARRLVPFEVAVTAVASRARDGDDLVDRVHGIDELPTLLPHHDLVIVVVPLTDDTRGLVDDAFLSAVPDDALVVNVARGPVADTDAVVRHAGRLAFALDVTDPEPLPDGHPLYTAPRVLISPHVGGDTHAFRPRAVRMLREQLTRMVAGEEPMNVVRRPDPQQR